MATKQDKVDEILKMWHKRGFLSGKMVRIKSTEPSQPWYRRWVRLVSEPFWAGEGFATMVFAQLNPGDATSVTALDISTLETDRETIKQFYVHYGVCSGLGQFPWDMLRYDFCQLTDFSLDPFKMGEPSKHIPNLYRIRMDSMGQPPKFEVAQINNDRKPRWTPDRWQSFLWGFKPHEDKPYQHIDTRQKPEFRGYQAVGWHPSIKPDARRSNNLSDGAIFSRREWAEQYVKDTGMTLINNRLREIENPTPAAVDHLIRDRSWIPRGERTVQS